MRIAKEAWPFAVPLIVAALFLGVLLHPLALAVLALPIAFVLWFFRDPDRSAPGTPGALVSPADGRIIRAGPATVSVFMNVFNVHVCRSPVAGVVESVNHVPGRFLAAFKDSAPEQNERVAIDVGCGVDRRNVRVRLRGCGGRRRYEEQRQQGDDQR